MAKHYDTTTHNIVFSMMDGSFYCYECDSYITNLTLDKLRQQFSELKELDQLNKNLDNITINDSETV